MLTYGTNQGSTNASRLTKNDITLDFDLRKTGHISELLQEPRVKSNFLSLSWKLKEYNDPCQETIAKLLDHKFVYLC